MHILVCIKQVPGTTNVQIDPEKGTLKREGVEAIINPFDEYAIEEAVRLKEKVGGKVTVITMGPPQAESALREAISRGCDEAILIGDRAFAGADTWATAYAISTAIKTYRIYRIRPSVPPVTVVKSQYGSNENREASCVRCHSSTNNRSPFNMRCGMV